MSKLFALAFTLVSLGTFAETAYAEPSCQIQSTCVQQIGDCAITDLTFVSSGYFAASATIPYTVRKTMACVTNDGKIVTLPTYENHVSDKVFGDYRFETGISSPWAGNQESIQLTQKSALTYCQTARPSMAFNIQRQYGGMCPTN